MKGNRLILLIASVLLLTISSGLLFYKNLFLMEGPGTGGKVDFEELRYTDLQVNATAALMRKNLSSDSTALKAEVNRVKELLNIITDVNKSTTELANSIVKINEYFDKKIKDVENFQIALKDLKSAVDALNPSYYELVKNNIKFTVEKRDFYRECVVDALLYVSASNRDNELRLQDDKKILGQVLNFANTPNPHIQRFSNNMETILNRTKEIDRIMERFNGESSISSEMNIVAKYYKESLDSKAQAGEIFLTMVFGAIVLYLLSIVYILRKLT